MKRHFFAPLIFALVFNLCACSGQESNSDASASTSLPPETTVEETSTAEAEEPDIPLLSLGETASTDIVDFTLNDAAFSIYASPILDESYLMPIEETDNTIYSAAIGRSLVITTFTVNNKDRSGSLNIGSNFSRTWHPIEKVLYNGEEFKIKSFDLSDKDGAPFRDIRPAAIVETGNMMVKIESTNYLLDAGKEVSIRTIGVVGFEPDELSDAFEILVSLPNSAGEYEYFTYTIPKRAND